MMTSRSQPLGTMRQTLRFGLVGVLNTIVDLGVFLLLVRITHVNVLVAQTISYACGLCNSYLWNRSLTFPHQSRPNASEVVKFVAVNGMSYGISELVLYALARDAWPLLAIKALITALTLVVNFIGSKWWVFRSYAADHPGGNPAPGDLGKL